MRHNINSGGIIVDFWPQKLLFYTSSLLKFNVSSEQLVTNCDSQCNWQTSAATKSFKGILISLIETKICHIKA